MCTPLRPFPAGRLRRRQPRFSEALDLHCIHGYGNSFSFCPQISQAQHCPSPRRWLHPSCRCLRHPLSPRHRHVARDGRLLGAAVDDEVVALGLAGDRLVDRLVEQLVAFWRAAACAGRPRRPGRGTYRACPCRSARTRLQLSQKLCVSGVMKPSRPPVSSTRRSAPGRRCDRRCRRACSVISRARTSDSGRYWSVRSPSISPSGMVSISVRSMPRAVRPADQVSISSSLTPLSATALILIEARLLARRRCPPSPCEVAPAGDRLELVRRRACRARC